MGLDAHVHCDCVERGRLTKPHPWPDLLKIAPDGAPEIDSEDEAQKEDDWRWFISGACPHEDFQLLSIRLGNIGLVSEVRAAIEAIAAYHQTQFPVMRDQVVYSGSHCGDCLDLAAVETLAAEIARLRALSWDALDIKPTAMQRLARSARIAFERQRAGDLTEFLDSLDELIIASRAVRKPICF